MGDIDRLYRAERDQAQRYRVEVERLREANDGWSKFGLKMEAELRRERALCDDLAAALDQFADDWLGEDCEGPVSRLLARYREVRPQ